MRLLFFLYLLLIHGILDTKSFYSYSNLEHPLAHKLFEGLKTCDHDLKNCDDQSKNGLYLDTISLINQQTSVYLFDNAESILLDIIYYLDDSSNLFKKINRLLSSIYFAQGKDLMAKALWSKFDKEDLSSKRAIMAQNLLISPKAADLKYFQQYSSSLSLKFQRIVDSVTAGSFSYDNYNGSVHKSILNYNKTTVNSEFEGQLISIILQESNGYLRSVPKLTDLMLITYELNDLDEKFRFKLGIQLYKLGLIELSTKQLSLAATPWSPSLFRLKVYLEFPSFYSSVRFLAYKIQNFEKHCDDILMSNPKRVFSDIEKTCDSINDISVIFSSLPLFHLAGIESSRQNEELWHGSTPLPALLSEVYCKLCGDKFEYKNVSKAFSTVFPNTITHDKRISLEKRRIKVGVVSGSFDTFHGHIMIGLIESMQSFDQVDFKFIAACFPTPRDQKTDKLSSLFDGHVNLPPNEKKQAIQKLLEAELDVVIFSDAHYDSRVFALAHERFAEYQIVYWGWGGTIGIPSIDYFIAPDVFFKYSKCPWKKGMFKKPYDIYKEQVVLLEGIPHISKEKKFHLTEFETRIYLQKHFFFSTNNQTHLYLIPASIKQIHPEFDMAIKTLLAADSSAYVVIAQRVSGRDSLPYNHAILLHDLMHPTTNNQEVSRFYKRLQFHLGDDKSRVKALPPLDEEVYKGLLKICVATLDLFPVGLHLPILESIYEQIPVVSAPKLQECTNSYAFGMSQYFNISLKELPSEVKANGRIDSRVSDNNEILSPQTPEEYGFLAARLSRESGLRHAFMTPRKSDMDVSMQSSRFGANTHGTQLVQFLKSLLTF